MPNWCSNALIIRKRDSSSQENYLIDISDIYYRHFSRENIFNTIITMPSDYINDYGASGKSPLWYEWRIDNWSTKWDVSEKDVNFYQTDDEYPHMVFSTAWSPPYKVIEKLSKMYIHCEFTLAYSEFGMGFSGVIKYVNGEITECYEYSMDIDKDYSYNEDYGHTPVGKFAEFLNKFKIDKGG